MFKIGEFSKISQVSIPMLRHYDKIGLLHPARTDSESGYRYYSVEQLPVLNRIMALKDLGFTLEQVRQLLNDNVSLDEIQGMLRLREAQIEQQIDEEQRRLQRVRGRLDQLQWEGASPEYEVVVKSIDEQQYLSTGWVTLPDTVLKSINRETAQLLEQCQWHTSGLCHVIIHAAPDPGELHNVETGYGVVPDAPESLTLDDGRVLEKRLLRGWPEVASVVHRGPRQRIPNGFSAIGRWMETNGFKVRGRFREIYLRPGENNTDPENVVELQIPIRSISD